MSCQCWENKCSNNNKPINEIKKLYETKYDNLCQLKNSFINYFVEKNNIKSVTEIECGDGNRTLNSNYKEYHGYDKNKFAIEIAKITFVDKNFYEINDNTIFHKSDLSISLDVDFDNIEKHIKQLVEGSKKYIIIFTKNNLYNNIKNFDLKIIDIVKKNDYIFYCLEKL